MIRMSGIGESRPWPLIPVRHWKRPYLKILLLILTLGNVVACRVAEPGPRTIASPAAGGSRR